MSERDQALTPDETGTTRRRVLRAAGLAALGGGGVSALAACSPSAQVAAPAATSAAPTAAPTSAAATSATPSAAASSAATTSAPAAPTGPSIAVADVPVGGGVILEDAKYVVTQPTKGKFKAFSSICTHQGCPVAEVSGDTINCDCHGSKFSIRDGSVVNPPAQKPLPESPTTVSGDSVFVEA